MAPSYVPLHPLDATAGDRYSPSLGGSIIRTFHRRWLRCWEQPVAKTLRVLFWLMARGYGRLARGRVIP